jgi:hypothetical protein
MWEFDSRADAIAQCHQGLSIAVMEDVAAT